MLCTTNTTPLVPPLPLPSPSPPLLHPSLSPPAPPSLPLSSCPSPRVAHVQVVVVPCGITAQLGEEEGSRIMRHCQQFTKGLEGGGVRAHLDARDNYSPGWKFYHWEQKVCVCAHARVCACVHACGCEVVRVWVSDMLQVFFKVSVTCTEMVNPIPTFPGCSYQSGNWSQGR